LPLANNHDFWQYLPTSSLRSDSSLRPDRKRRDFAQNDDSSPSREKKENRKLVIDHSSISVSVCFLDLDLGLLLSISILISVCFLDLDLGLDLSLLNLNLSLNLIQILWPH
jgi:hypothetical protein